MVATTEGARSIESLRAGDTVEAFSSEQGAVRSKVLAVVAYETTEWIEIRLGRATLRATPDHPFLLADHRLLMASHLREGDSLAGGAVVTGLRSHRSPLRVFNLITAWPNTYFAEGVVVHNKGCFLPDTPVRLADGTEKEISALRPTERVTAFDPEGNLTVASIRNVFTAQVADYFEIETREGSRVRATAEHPFFVGHGEFRLVESLRPGDQVETFHDRMALETIQFIRHVEAPTLVYNLQTDYPNTFLAAGFAVHNKGGGGGGGFGGGSGHLYYYGGHSYSSCGAIPDGAAQETCIAKERREGLLTIAFALLVTIAISGPAFLKGRAGSKLDFRYPEAKIEPKATSTENLVGKIAAFEPKFDLTFIKARAQLAFLTLQKEWEQREYKEMAPLVFPDLRAQHELQLQSMKRNHEINMISDLSVDRIRIVQVHYEKDLAHCEFTALIEAKARDYYLDDRTKKILRGDVFSTAFQEFWVFQYHCDAWLLREIQQAFESKALQTENFATIPHVSPGSVEGESIAKAPLGKLSGKLREYAVQNPIWDEQGILRLARSCAICALSCLEDGQLDRAAGKITERMRTKLQKDIDSFRGNQETLEMRNLCVRSAEVVLVRKNPDEFSVRVWLHAQQRSIRAGQVIRADEDVVPFALILHFVLSGSSFLLDDLVHA